MLSDLIEEWLLVLIDHQAGLVLLVEKMERAVAVLPPEVAGALVPMRVRVLQPKIHR